MRNKKIKRLVFTAMLAAMTCVATMIIRIPTPTFGYIHPGDAFVLLSGIILGPWGGALAAGTGSMFSDIFSGYLSFAPGTFVIKALTALVSGFIFRRFGALSEKNDLRRYVTLTLGGVLGEAVMVFGYFIYEAGLAAFGSGGFSQAALAAGIASSAAGIPFNLVQGTVGILLCVLLFPLLQKVPDIRECMA